MKLSAVVYLVPLLFGLVLGPVGCGGKMPPPKPWEEPAWAATAQDVRWTYEPGTIRLHLQAEPDLNRVNGRAHTLLVCVYQLSVPQAFRELASGEEGIRTLLAGKRFDASVLSVERAVMEPGRSRELRLDRAEGAKYVALAAGYNQLVPGQVDRILDIPLQTRTTGSLFWKTREYAPAVLEAYVLLGAEAMQLMGESAENEAGSE